MRTPTTGQGRSLSRLRQVPFFGCGADGGHAEQPETRHGRGSATTRVPSCSIPHVSAGSPSPLGPAEVSSDPISYDELRSGPVFSRGDNLMRAEGIMALPLLALSGRRRRSPCLLGVPCSSHPTTLTARRASCAPFVHFPPWIYKGRAPVTAKPSATKL